MKLTYELAWKLVGGLSSPSKMPCHGWSISARRCNVGSKLRSVVDSVCSKCYALKGNYMFPSIQECLERRYGMLQRKTFVPAMVYLLNTLTPRYFRWYDSGDLDTIETLKKIVDIANQVPDTKFWLPTKEYKLVQDYIKEGGVIPANLCVRLSSYMIDESGPIVLATRLGLTISEVRKAGFTCPASNQGNKCLDCRACWDKNTFLVAYKKH